MWCGRGGGEGQAEDDFRNIEADADAASDSTSCSSASSSPSAELARAHRRDVASRSDLHQLRNDLRQNLVFCPRPHVVLPRGVPLDVGTVTDWRSRRWAQWRAGRNGRTGGVGQRKRLLTNAVHVFHVDWMTALWDDKEMEARRQSLQELQHHFGPTIFAHSRSQCPFSAPPEEVFQPVDADELWNQYCRLKRLVPSIMRIKERADAIMRLVAIEVECAGVVRRVPGTAVDMSTCIVTRASAGCADETETETVVVRRYGRVRLLRRIFEKQDHQFHALLMGMKYEVVSTKRIWHILRLYHRVVIWSCDSEAIAEHVGSIVRYIEKKHATGRPLETANLVRAVRLRAVGVRGDMSDAVLIMRAMRLHFERRKHAAHFFLTSRRPLAVEAQMLGPSVVLSKLRHRIEARRATRHRWLLSGLDLQEVACKRVAPPRTGTQASYAPDEFPPSVWDVVRHHLDDLDLRHGAQPIGTTDRTTSIPFTITVAAATATTAPHAQPTPATATPQSHTSRP